MRHPFKLLNLDDTKEYLLLVFQALLKVPRFRKLVEGRFRIKHVLSDDGTILRVDAIDVSDSTEEKIYKN